MTTSTRFTSNNATAISVTSGGMATFNAVGTATISGSFSFMGGDPDNPVPQCPTSCPPDEMSGTTPGNALPNLSVEQVSFNASESISKDQAGGASVISNPVWTNTNSPDQNNPVAYVRNSTMSVTVKFAVSPVPTSPVSGVTIEGQVSGLGTFRQTGVTIPAASEMTISNITADTALPNTTKFYNPMTITWQHTQDGQSCPNCIQDGSTANKVYVTLAAALNTIYLTSLNLAVSTDGASDQATAFQNTWAQFAGPANVTGWDGRLLYYYRSGVPFSACAVTEQALLTATNGSGQCGSWANLLMGALGDNGISASFVQIGVLDSSLGFLVKNFTFGSPSFAGTGAYQWGLTLNPSAVAAGDFMVPPQPGNVYGDLTSLSTLPGQNSTPPSEKIFARHFIVKVTLPGISPSYYDPSYGVTYVNAADFENKAVDGYFIQVATDPSNVLRVKHSTGLNNISFSQ